MNWKRGRIAIEALALVLLGGCSTAATTAPAITTAPVVKAEPTAVDVTPPATGEVIMVDPVDVLPRVLHRVEPVYPQELLQRRVSGDIGLRVYVLDDGTVGQVKTKFTRYLEFMVPARDAVQQWRFEPAIKDGRPTACWVEIRFTISPP